MAHRLEYQKCNLPSAVDDRLQGGIFVIGLNDTFKPFRNDLISRETTLTVVQVTSKARDFEASLNTSTESGINRFHVTSHNFRSPYWWSSFSANFKMALGTQENEVKSSEHINQKASITLSDYTNKLEPKVNKCYLLKISAIVINPVLIESKNFELDCLPLVESTDILFYLDLETSYYTKQ